MSVGGAIISPYNKKGNIMSDELTPQEVAEIDALHTGHNTCIRFFIDGDPHQYCEDCNEPLYFVEFTDFDGIAKYAIGDE